MRCENCGMEIEKGNNFCKKCGAKLKKQNHIALFQLASEKRRKMAVAVICVLLALAIISACFLRYNEKTNDSMATLSEEDKIIQVVEDTTDWNIDNIQEEFLQKEDDVRTVESRIEEPNEEPIEEPSEELIEESIEEPVKTDDIDEIQSSESFFEESMECFEDEVSQEQTYSPFSNVEEGDSVYFGLFKQRKDGYYYSKSDIEWIVLKVSDDKILVLSKYILDVIPFNENNVEVTWDSCSLRTWLNDTFINDAFSEEEKERIATTHISAVDPDILFSKGVDTEDQVFLLSEDESEIYFQKEERRASPTNYAAEKKPYSYRKHMIDGNYTCDWWVISPGHEGRDFAFVDSEGTLYSFGYHRDKDSVGVRPAMWLYR